MMNTKTEIEQYLKTIEIAQERGDKRQEGEAYLRIGHVYYGVDQHQTAIEYYRKANEIAQERGDKRQDAEACIGIGHAYRGVDEHRPAIEYYQKAKEIAQERGDKRQEVEAYIGIGHAYRGVDEHRPAIEYYQKAKEIAQGRGDKRQEVEGYLGIAYAYRGVHEHQTAIEYYQKAKEIAQEREDKRQEGEAYLGTGHAYHDFGKHRTAIEYYEKAKAIAQEQGDKRQEGEAYLGIGNAKQCVREVEGQSKALWTKTSIKHRDKFEKLVKVLETEPKKAIKVGTYSVCLNSEYVIGRGSDGTTVYIGLCDDGIEVAVKSLLLDRCEHLGSNEKEILNYSNVRKERHIVNYRFYSSTVDSTNAYLILDLFEESLENYVAESSKAMLESKGVTFMRQILLGLKALHCGDPEILHRDLKPSNIFVNVEGELVLGDLGIGRKLLKGQTTCKSGQTGTRDWIAVESLSTKENDVRYKKQSDIQVAGMVLFYILTKGEHPYGESASRTYHLSKGNPVNLKNLSDPLAKDLIEWMLQHDLKERPGVEECLKHPYLMSTDEMFHFVTRVGNELEIKTKDINSVVVKQLNADPSLPKPSWKPKIDAQVMKYVSGHRFYSNDVTDLLRLIRNTTEHWRDKTPPTTVQAKVGTPKEYFLNLFPTLPVVLHRIIRKDLGWKQREQLKQFF